MRSKWVLLFLAAVWLTATGASVDGPRDARDWQHAADMAYRLNVPEVAYGFYEQTAELFPKTKHGRYCRSRARATWKKLRGIRQSNAINEPIIAEVVDFLTW